MTIHTTDATTIRRLISPNSCDLTPMSAALSQSNTEGLHLFEFLVEGIMAAYASALHNVTLAGPTLFGQVINTAADIAGHSISNINSRYFVLLIITKGHVWSSLPIEFNGCDTLQCGKDNTSKQARLQILSGKVHKLFPPRFNFCNEINCPISLGRYDTSQSDKFKFFKRVRLQRLSGNVSKLFPSRIKASNATSLPISLGRCDTSQSDKYNFFKQARLQILSGKVHKLFWPRSKVSNEIKFPTSFGRHDRLQFSILNSFKQLKRSTGESDKPIESTLFVLKFQDERYGDSDLDSLIAENFPSMEQPDRSRFSRVFNIQMLEGSFQSFLQFFISRTTSFLRNLTESSTFTNLMQSLSNSFSRLLSPEKLGVLVR
ncbi:hypothetical protein RHMOL_Rhmol08G0227000 [Rhododendron molle]|uniref:Uncharacterized protein n=1 Tax=Rhododendron molle TaxID=49168 RepID=A0ACC0MSD4_RHOML|nr:hypothetical protein RHMOL_Rhmol08G0227000 [Rhododendron molle]